MEYKTNRGGWKNEGGQRVDQTDCVDGRSACGFAIWKGDNWSNERML